MKKSQTDIPKDIVSRRTGLDRRWIPSPGHQPERRRGNDRRAVKSRRFTDRFDTVVEDASQEGLHVDTQPETSLPASELSDKNATWPHIQFQRITDPDPAIDG